MVKITYPGVNNLSNDFDISLFNYKNQEDIGKVLVELQTNDNCKLSSFLENESRL